MKPRVFDGMVKGGKLGLGTHTAINAFLPLLEGKQVEVEIRVRRKRRSSDQNAFFHGPVLDQLEDFYREAGSTLNREDIKQHVKELCGIWDRKVLPGGGTKRVLRSTADYTTAEMEEFLERLRAYFAGWGLQILRPNEHLEPPL